MKQDRPIIKRRRPPTSISLEGDDDIFDYLRTLATCLGKDTLTSDDIEKDGKISPATIMRRFGGFSRVLIKAGLRPSRTYRREPDEMLRQLRDLITRLGRHPSKTEITENLPYNAYQYDIEFGSRKKACELAEIAHRITAGAAPASAIATARNPAPSGKASRRYGAIIEFRGLRHAPINEQGVVFLFGMLAHNLGFIVESIQAGFPDCEAKRQRKDGSFERVRIEFEFKSSEFLRHKHNFEECDLIVCWQHDWSECPLEVIELSKVIAKPLAIAQ